MQENRYTYHFEDLLKIGQVRELIEVLAQHQKVDLFITTEGGETVSTQVLLHYLNQRKEDIVLYFTDYLMSAGVLLLTDFEGKKVITDNLDYIMTHKIDRMVYMNREQVISTKYLQEGLQETNKEVVKKLVKLGLTKQEIKDYNAGKDVVLFRNDFKRLKF